MPAFLYNGRSREGKKVVGEISGTSKEAVAKQLQRDGVIPLSITPKSIAKELHSSDYSFSLSRLIDGDKLKPDDLIFFSRQMYTLSRSSVPLLSALDGLLKTADNQKLADIIRKLKEGLDEGLDLTGAMRRQPHVFSELYVNLIHIGETTGKLAEIFEELSHYLQKEKETREKVKSALSYPITVIFVITIGLAVVNMFVLPAFSNMFNSFNAVLPLPTRILIKFSEFTSDYGYFIVTSLILSVFALRRYVKTPIGKMKWHEAQYRIPLVGSLLLQNTASRFARTLSITSRAGVPMEQSLQIIGPALGNIYMEKKVASLRLDVERGESITNSISRAKIFPGLVVQMISVGEDSGTLDDMVLEVALYYDREIEEAIKKLTAAIEPIMIAFIAIIVLILAMGIFLPMISLMGAIN